MNDYVIAQQCGLLLTLATFLGRVSLHEDNIVYLKIIEVLGRFSPIVIFFATIYLWTIVFQIHMKFKNFKSESVEKNNLNKTMIVLLGTNFIASSIIEKTVYELVINGYQVFGVLLIFGGIHLLTIQNFRRANWNNQKEVSQYVEDVQEKMRSDLIIQEGRIFNNSNSQYISIQKSILIQKKIHDIFSKKVELKSKKTSIVVSEIYSDVRLCGNKTPKKTGNDINVPYTSASKKDRVIGSNNSTQMDQDKNSLKEDLISRIIQINYWQHEVDKENENTQYSIEYSSNNANSEILKKPNKSLLKNSPIIYQYFTNEMLNQAEKEVYNDWQKKHYDTLADSVDKNSVYDTQFDEENLGCSGVSMQNSNSSKSDPYYNVFSYYNPAERLRIPLDSPISVYININFAYNYSNFYFMDKNRIQFIKRKNFFSPSPAKPITHATQKSFKKTINEKHIYIGQCNDYNEKEGFGAEYWDDGTILYDGSWINDKKNGFGYLYWRSGTVMYCGEFKDNFLNGYGIQYDLKGNVKQSGLFSEGSFVNDKRVQIDDCAQRVKIYLDGKSRPEKTYNTVKPQMLFI